MKKNTLSLLIALAGILFLASCGSTKDVPYFKNSQYVDLSESQFLYDARIMPKDQLTITVNATNQEAALPFNMIVNTALTGNRTSGGSYGQLQTYLVDNKGDIEFPILGTIHLGGLTKGEAEALIRKRILPFMSGEENPIVTVRMVGYQISVLGEVSHPGTFTVSREKITILEALAQAGDLTIHGVRDNVKLIREDSTGKKTIVELNLNDANIINSPYYYLQQNDVVYVTPNKVKAQNSSIGSMTTLWFSATSILISLTSLLYNILL